MLGIVINVVRTNVLLYKIFNQPPFTSTPSRQLGS